MSPLNGLEQLHAVYFGAPLAVSFFSSINGQFNVKDQNFQRQEASFAYAGCIYYPRGKDLNHPLGFRCLP